MEIDIKIIMYWQRITKFSNEKKIIKTGLHGKYRVNPIKKGGRPALEPQSNGWGNAWQIESNLLHIEQFRHNTD